MDKNQNPPTTEMKVSVLSMNRHAALATCLSFNETGLVLKSDATDEQIIHLAKNVTEFGDRLSSARRWWVGDLISGAEGRGRDLFEKVALAAQMNVGDVQNCATVSRAYGMSDRIAGLSWSIHRECARMSDTRARRELLEDALKSGYGVRQVATMVRKWRIANGFERPTKTAEDTHAEPIEKPAPESMAGQTFTINMFDVVAFLKHATTEDCLKVIEVARLRIGIAETGADTEAASDEFDAGFAALDATLNSMKEAA